MQVKSNLLVGGAFVWLLASTASAQAQPAAPAAEAADAATDNIGLQDIVVTAQRRSENLQKVAIAVSAVSGENLVNAGISQPQELGRIVPAIKLQQGGGSNVSIYLRGVGSLTGNAFGENSVAFNFNGAYVARPTALAGTLFDLARVEVVKGPQGTLYGRNATGGAINIIPRAPELGAVSGEVIAEYGNYSNKRLSGALNVPLGDVVALRVAGRLVDRDGYLSDGSQDEVNQAARASLLIKPSGDWSATIVADYYHQGGKGPGSVLLPGSNFPAGTGSNSAPKVSDRIGGSDPASIAFLRSYLAGHFAGPPFCAPDFVTSGCAGAPGRDAFADDTIYGITGTIEGDMGFATLTFVPSYRHTKSNERNYLPGFQADRTETADQVAGELRLTSRTDQALRYVLGAYYFNEKVNASNFFNLGRLSRALLQPRLETQSKALFGQLSFDLAPGFRLIGGARYTHETKTQFTRSGSGGPFSPTIPVLGAPYTGALSIDKVTWKAGAEWDAGPQSLVYANVATGFKSGGFYTAAPPVNTFAPEKLTAYTIGTKNRFLGNRLQINVEGFYWDFRDQQITYVGGIQTGSGVVSGGVTTNAGKATVYGVELETLFAVTRLDQITANAQYLHSQYDSLTYQALSPTGAPLRNACGLTPGPLANPGVPTDFSRFYTVNCSGRPTINAPRWTADFGYQHTFELGELELVAAGRVRFESSRYMELTYLPEARQGAYETGDVSLTLRSPGSWSVTGYVNNVTNKTVLEATTLKPLADVVYGAPAPPRTYGVRASYAF